MIIFGGVIFGVQSICEWWLAEVNFLLSSNLMALNSPLKRFQLSVFFWNCTCYFVDIKVSGLSAQWFCSNTENKSAFAAFHL